MLNLNAEEDARFLEALKMMTHSEHGRVFLSALEMDLKRLDALNRVVGSENRTSAAAYLGKLFEKASNAGYKPAYPYVVLVNQEPTNVVTPKSRWQRILTALFGTER